MNLKNHVCVDTKVNGVPFSAKIIAPKGQNNVRTLIKLRKLNNIVVHNTGNKSAGADDRNHSLYLQNTENADKDYVSWHITVDSDSAIQNLPFDEVGYHAGDDTGAGNYESIGIEICENKDYAIAELNAIKIICDLMKTYNIKIDNVLPHRYFSPNKKLCPHNILKSESDWQKNWKAFQDRVMKVYNDLYMPKPKPAPTPVKHAPAPVKPVMRVGATVTVTKAKLYKSSMSLFASGTISGTYPVTMYSKGKFNAVHIDGKGWVKEKDCKVIK